MAKIIIYDETHKEIWAFFDKTERNNHVFSDKTERNNYPISDKTERNEFPLPYYYMDKNLQESAKNNFSL